MPIVILQVVIKHRHVVDDFALPVAEIVRGPDVVSGHVIVVVDIPPVNFLRIERTVGAFTNAALGCLK